MSYEEKKVFCTNDPNSGGLMLSQPNCLSSSVLTSGLGVSGASATPVNDSGNGPNDQYSPYDNSDGLMNLINSELSPVSVSLSSPTSNSVLVSPVQQQQPQSMVNPSSRICDQLILSMECSPNSNTSTMTRLHSTHPQHQHQVQHQHQHHHPQQQQQPHQQHLQHPHQQQHHQQHQNLHPHHHHLSPPSSGQHQSPSPLQSSSGLGSPVTTSLFYRLTDQHPKKTKIEIQLDNGSTGSYLRIVEEPTNRIRYRYKSEKGSHGGLTGENSSQNKKTYPTVKLKNYRSSNQVHIKASLYTNDSTPKLHVHKLMGKHCNENGFCILPLGDNNQAVFQNLGILFVGKKEVPEILYQRKLEEHKLICALSDRSQLSESDRERLREEADREAKRINLNCVKICFQAFDQSQGMNFPICDAVFSRPIANQKSPDSGELKIVRMDKYSGVCTGNEEVFLLCEKVNKKEIKIRFFETDMDGNQTWESFASFTEADVHHQVAIVFRTPPYHNTNIDRSVQVYAQLYRPKDGEYSEPRPFTYKPKPVDQEGVERKRKKMSTHFNSAFPMLGGNIIVPGGSIGPQSSTGNNNIDGGINVILNNTNNVNNNNNSNNNNCDNRGDNQRNMNDRRSSIESNNLLGGDNNNNGSGNNNGRRVIGNGGVVVDDDDSDQYVGYTGNGRSYFLSSSMSTQGPNNSSTEPTDVNYYGAN
ncbi:nuclear factor NF-kappa-B p100 subunit-like isoform X2 [Panonychus citri]|uniref:nuclear factor NF-kappa-B p100 subunit-like isoform X2 n=1 Tax=Panonychus citri TaxID=50023 RepID=UPI002307EF0B|nr:nuclear factor NF-kappa-B p100 subunit-like isoform X2 [Panonychus citri]